MSLVSSLLAAIVRADGEALVLHVGDRPYVISPTGRVDIATREITLAAVSGIIAQLLPPEARATLDESGAAEHGLSPVPEFPGEQFTVVVARGGADVLVEIRRLRLPEEEAASTEAVQDWHVTPAPAVEPVVQARARDEDRQERHDSSTKSAPPASGGATEAPASRQPSDSSVERSGPVVRVPAFMPTPPAAASAAKDPATTAKAASMPRVPAFMPTEAAAVSRESPVTPAEPSSVWDSSADIPAPAPGAPGGQPSRVEDEALGEPGAVLPLSRAPIRHDAPPPLADQALSGLDRLLRLAAARGASTLYLSSGARPSVRVDGAVQALDGAPVFDAKDVESLLLTLMPERDAEALRKGTATEWIRDLPAVGRVRCMTFRDHRGPGGVFRMMPVKAVTAEQLGLSREIQALALEREGLVLIAGPRSSGKRTLMSAFVDLINRNRRDHVVTIEREIDVVHEGVAAFISQREVRGGPDNVLNAAQAALREDPDVLVIQELRTAALIELALGAAANQLVIGCFPASTASEAIDRIIDLYAPEERRRVQLSLAQHLRGVVAQVLLTKAGGGRLAARELLLCTPAVAGVLVEGKTSQLPLAIEGGRNHGMVPLNDAIVGFVQSGAVDVREAYRRSADRVGFLALLKRQGLDTSFAERLA
jgi:twitching motility protein PilT